MERKTIGIENLKLIVNILISLVILLLCIFVVPRLVLFFMPFVIGWIISCIANPLVVFLERKLKIKRKAGIVVVIVCVSIIRDWLPLLKLWAVTQAGSPARQLWQRERTAWVLI